MTYVSEVLADSPDVYFRLGEGGSGPLVDAVAAHNLTPDGTIVNDVNLLTNTADGSVKLDYSTAFTKGTSTYTLSQRPLTVEFFCKPATLTGSSNGFSHVVGCSPTGGWDIEYKDTTGRWQITYEGVASYLFAAGSAAAVGVIQQVVMVLQTGNTVDLYTNGTFRETIATGALGATTNKLTIGGFDGLSIGRPKCSLDELSIYKSALTSGRIAAHYDASVSKATSRYQAVFVGGFRPV